MLTENGIVGDPRYYDIPEWGQKFVTDGRGVPLLVRRVPAELPQGGSGLLDLTRLTPEQRLAGDAFHELGHAIGYLHFGVPVAISMKEHKGRGSSAHVTPWSAKFEKMTSEQVRIVLAAGEWAGMRWLRESGLWNPLDEYVLEIRSSSDRMELRDVYEVTFGEASSPRDFDALLSTTEELLGSYWNLLRSHAPDLARSEWWGWDEAAERLGFADLLSVEHRLTSKAIRDSSGKRDGVHRFNFDEGEVLVTRKDGDWESFTAHIS